MMKKSLKASLALILAMGISLVGCNNANDSGTSSGKTSSTADSNGGTTSGQDTQIEEIDPASVSGTVRVSLPNWGGTAEADAATYAMDKFNEIYPNIEIIYDNWAGAEGLSKHLTVKASASELPDVVLGWESMGFFHTQNWVAPLEEMMATDPDASYIPQIAKDSFAINGKTYAVPFDVVFNGVVVNLDLIETLNEDDPGYEWTLEDFVRLAKKSTTDEYSGLTHSWNLSNLLGTMSDSTLWVDQYNPETHKFDFTSGSWAKGIKYVNDLKAINGLFGDELKNQALVDAGEIDDYQKKFGKDADALKDGKILMHADGTWEKGGWHKDLPFNWDYYPLPQDASVGYRNPAHFNYVFMTTAASDDNKQASYEVLKYLSHGVKGNLNRLDNAYNKINETTGVHDIHSVPISLHPDVVAKLKESKTIKPGELYMYENMDKSIRGDISKTTVDIGAIVNPHLDPIRDDLMTGKISPDAVAADIEAKVNAEFDKLYGEVLAALE